MATGKIFGEDKPVQRNKENVAGDRRPNRSPAQSNAARSLPALKENVGASQRADVGRIAKALKGTEAKGAAAKSVAEAGGRAVLRTAARGAGLAGAALAGYDAAKTIGTAMTERGERKYAERQQKKREADAEMKRESNRGKPSKEMTKETSMPKKTTADGGLTAFGKAFKEARADGKEMFTFNSKKYHTKVKEEISKLAKGGVVKKSYKR